MFRTLIVPLDGSEQAERALPYAVRLAQADGGGLVLVRAALGPPPSGQDWERQQEDAISEAEAYLTTVAEKLATRVRVRTSVPYGRAADQILEAVDSFDADGVIMTTRSRTGIPHVLSGSVAERVSSRATVPVLLIHARSDEAPAVPFDLPSARILVPLDGSALSETALPIATAILGIAGELVLMTVVEPPLHVLEAETSRITAYLDQQENALQQNALDYLGGLVRKLRADNPDLHVTSDVRIGAPTEGILIAELDRAADLVVMATHGRTGMSRAVTGSIAGDVVRNGRTPVLLVPPHAFTGGRARLTTTMSANHEFRGLSLR